ncbi:MAG: class I SAM-dependent methyltransferase [Actinomycetota bacterium]|nr:class I SAM-dependent methyltransferase [Actinomycetota bacterium]
MTDLAAEVAEHEYWYHSIELPGGITTPGIFDMPRARARVGMPASLSGKRCLDVGTEDGFWAFEMERRGASEVVAVDLGGSAFLDWPPAHGPVPEGKPQISKRFELAREALGSRVEWVPGSVYDLRPGMVGTFDFVFLGSMLLHLRDPTRALAAVRTVVDGELLVNDAVSLPLTWLRPWWPAARLVGGAGDPNWWIPNVAGLRRLVETAGYRVLASGRPYFLGWGKGLATVPVQLVHQVSLKPPHRIPIQLIRHLRDRMGIPHAWLLACPQPGLSSEPLEPHRSPTSA